jgi:hypothetical protein
MVILAKLETTPVDTTPVAVESNANRLMYSDCRRHTNVKGTYEQSSYANMGSHFHVRILYLHPHLIQISCQLPFLRLTFLGRHPDRDLCSMGRHRSSRSGAS